VSDELAAPWQETVFSGDAHEVFRSDHIEERVFLASVLRSCDVKVAKPRAVHEPGQASTYVCKFRYDHRAIGLHALSAEECSAMEPSA
jgi:hypothetical protein